LFCGIFDLRIVEEEGDSVGFVVGVVYGGSPGAYERDSVVAVTKTSDQLSQKLEVHKNKKIKHRRIEARKNRSKIWGTER